jgi:hypothetical protein
MRILIVSSFYPFLGQQYRSNPTLGKFKLVGGSPVRPGRFQHHVMGHANVEILLNAARPFNHPPILSLASIKADEVLLVGDAFPSALSVWIPPALALLPRTPLHLCIQRTVRAESLRTMVETKPWQSIWERAEHLSLPLTHVENRTKELEMAENISLYQS